MTSPFKEVNSATGDDFLGGSDMSETASELTSPQVSVGGESDDDTRLSMANFALIRVLGKGAYGKVFLVRKIGGPDSGRVYAMKVLKKTRVSIKQKTIEHTIAERKVLERLRGLPFIVHLVYAFQTESKLHIVMEFVGGGELFTHLCRAKRFDLASARIILAEILVALDNIHKRNIIYRDLKLENILLDEEGHVVLADFGLAKLFNDDELLSASSYCGTIEYMSPEVVKRADCYDECVDWWSLGVIAFELLTGCSPFTVDGAQNSTQEIAKRILSKPVPFPKEMNETARALIGALLTREPKRRLGAHGCDEIKRHRFFDGIDWRLVEARKISPPLRPTIANNVDVNNFAPEFTNQPPIFSPADPMPNQREIFRGYSFISPSVIFANDNVIGDEFLSENIQALIQTSPFFAKYEMDTGAEEVLGRGTFSICRRCKRRSDGGEFAVKIVSQRFARHALREIRILEALNPHENIVGLVDAYSDALHYYIVLELLRGGELLQALRKMVTFTEFQAAAIMTQLVHAVSHIHAKGIVHRDLKPENILFVEEPCENVSIRLVDFGFARVLPLKEGSENAAAAASNGTLVTPCCGTLFYAAPEVLDICDELPQYNEQCDLWSLGVILFTMLSGAVPFRARNNAESAADVIERIKRAEFSFDAPVWASVNDQAKDLITGLLTVDPKKRISLRQLAHHPWLTNSGINSSCVLQTPSVLPSMADETFNETMDAFITANRDGFHLMDVDTAPLLVKRRGMKRHLEKNANGGIAGDGSGAAIGAHAARKSSASQQQQLQSVIEEVGETMPDSHQRGQQPRTIMLDLLRGDGFRRTSESIMLRRNGNGESGINSQTRSQDKAHGICDPLEIVECMETDVADPPAGDLNDSHGQALGAQQQQQFCFSGTSQSLIAFTEYRDMRPSYLKYSRDDFFGDTERDNLGGVNGGSATRFNGEDRSSGSS